MNRVIYFFLLITLLGCDKKDCTCEQNPPTVLPTKKIKGYVNRIVMDSVNYINIDTTDWNYIAVVKTSTNGGKIYKNGNLVFSGNFQNVNYYYNRFDIGTEYYTSYAELFKGWIDEVRISNRERTLSEINSYYDSNMPFASDTNTIGLWHFDDNAGTSIAAIKGPVGNAVNPKWDMGKFGKSIYYNGIDTRTSMNMMIPTSNITLEFWFKPNGLHNIQTIVSCYGLFTSSFKISSF